MDFSFFLFFAGARALWPNTFLARSSIMCGETRWLEEGQEGALCARMIPNEQDKGNGGATLVGADAAVGGTPARAPPPNGRPGVIRRRNGGWSVSSGVFLSSWNRSGVCVCFCVASVSTWAVSLCPAVVRAALEGDSRPGLALFLFPSFRGCDFFGASPPVEGSLPCEGVFFFYRRGAAPPLSKGRARFCPVVDLRCEQVRYVGVHSFGVIL